MLDIDGNLYTLLKGACRLVNNPTYLQKKFFFLISYFLYLK